MSAVATRDSQAIALLCAPLAVGSAKPLTPSEWAKLAAAIHASPLERPGALVGLTAAELSAELGLGVDTADRVAALLDRGGTLAFELERLESRGIWLVTRPDDDYPGSLRRHLGARAPALLFGVGRRDAVPESGVAIVGSRDASDAALTFAEDLGRSVVANGGTVVSGAARGIDRIAMGAAMEAGGTAVGIVADSLVGLSQQPDVRVSLADERLTLLTPYAPEARFTVGNAMGRNKLIYCMSDTVVVVSTSAGSGGTWAGATENLKAGWAPLWAWTGEGAPGGNRELLPLGAQPIEAPDVGLFRAGDGEAFAVVSTDDRVTAESLERFLDVPRKESEVRAHFGLGQGTARALLREGVASRRLVREGRPYRYVVARAASQATLFDAA